jgi:uncharacterized phage protein (TIGR02220 family)
MSVKSSTWAWKQPLGGNLKLILLALADHADDRGICWPGTWGLADKCHTDRRTVTRNIRQLERLQLIKVEPRAPYGKQGTNLFTLALDRVLSENETAEIMSCRDGNLPPLVETPGVATGLSRDGTGATPRDGRNVQVGMAPAPPESSSEPSEQPSRNHHSLSGKPDGVTLLHDAEEILAELNKLAGKHYRARESGGKPSVNLEFIIGRLKSGATKEQGLQIVSMKVRQWKGNPEKREYLRPATLFNRAKFEQYLGEIADREQEKRAEVARSRPLINTPPAGATEILSKADRDRMMVEAGLKRPSVNQPAGAY